VIDKDNSEPSTENSLLEPSVPNRHSEIDSQSIRSHDATTHTLEVIEVTNPVVNGQNDNFADQKERLRREILTIEESIRAFEAKNNDLYAWSKTHQESFLWKVLSRINTERKEAAKSLDQYANFVRSHEQPELGTLTKTRKSFHKALLIGNAFIFLVALIFWNLEEIIAFLKQITFLEDIRVPSSFPSSGTILTYAISISFALLFSELIRYYNKWSEFSRKVTLVLWELDLIAKNTDHCRNETIRLDSLYPQIKDWLEILGNAINQPWQIRPEWLKSNSVDLSLDKSPFSLRFAQAEENDPAASRGLRRDAIERHLRPGWRSEVFDEQVNEIRKSLGLPKDRLSVESLDRDLTFSPGGPRSLVSRYITESGILERVARTQLVPLMQTVQTESIAKSRPPVTESRFNPLSEIVEDDLGLEEEKRLPWDDFLALPIGDDARSRTPLSVFSFSSAGRQSGHADRYQTIFQGPDRLKNRASSGGTFYASYSTQTKLPLDILVRVDVSGPLTRDDLLISQRTREELDEFESEYQRGIQEKQGRWRSSGT